MIAQAKVIYPILVRQVHAELMRITGELLDNGTEEEEDDLDLDVRHRGRFIRGEWVPLHRLPAHLRPDSQPDLEVEGAEGDAGVMGRADSRREVDEMDKKILESETVAEHMDCYHFVSTMLAFLRALVRFSQDGEKLVTRKQITSEKRSTVGFTPELMNLSATYLQMSYRICITSMQIKPQRVWQPDLAMFVWQKPTATNTQDVITKLEKMKENRLKILKTIQFQRNRTRFPIPEAIYAAKW
eukprot:gene21626-27989_t